MKRREPHRYTVLRYLSLAADDARRGRLPMKVRHAISHAISQLYLSKGRP